MYTSPESEEYCVLDSRPSLRITTSPTFTIDRARLLSVRAGGRPQGYTGGVCTYVRTRSRRKKKI
jgi:hypothetical protein